MDFIQFSPAVTSCITSGYFAFSILNLFSVHATYFTYLGRVFLYLNSFDKENIKFPTGTMI